jgi:hypothetical protein
MQILYAEISFVGVGGDRIGTLTMKGTSIKDSFHDKISISGSLENMAILARLLQSNCPTAAIHGESEWAMATELPNGDLLVCIRPDTKMVMIEEDDVAFILDAFSLPGIRFHDSTPRHDSGHPCISLNWDDNMKVQGRDARLWEWKGGRDRDALINALVECPWAVFENVIL